MDQHPWFERKFNFDFSENIFPSLLERLEATSVMIVHKIEGHAPTKLKTAPEGKWTVLENIGHLTDLEPLWQQRIKDILAGASVMAATDLNNTATFDAGHNNKSVDEIVHDFSTTRKITLAQFRAIREEDIFRSSMHPRLGKPMRMIDLCLFIAEHDVHHLATISKILSL